MAGLTMVWPQEVRNTRTKSKVGKGRTSVISEVGRLKTKKDNSGLGFYHWKGKAIFNLQRELNWPVCYVFERARAPRHFLLVLKGTLWGNCKFLLDHFKGTKAMTRGHGGNRLREVSGLALIIVTCQLKLDTETCALRTIIWQHPLLTQYLNTPHVVYITGFLCHLNPSLSNHNFWRGLFFKML